MSFWTDMGEAAGKGAETGAWAVKTGSAGQPLPPAQPFVQPFVQPQQGDEGSAGASALHLPDDSAAANICRFSFRILSLFLAVQEHTGIPSRFSRRWKSIRIPFLFASSQRFTQKRKDSLSMQGSSASCFKRCRLRSRQVASPITISRSILPEAINSLVIFSSSDRARRE